MALAILQHICKLNLYINTNHGTLESSGLMVLYAQVKILSLIVTAQKWWRKPECPEKTPPTVNKGTGNLLHSFDRHSNLGSEKH